ncbi:hypothetical protein PYW08_012308 [Mythimna loreyi]|uniref:Uncharacterized protein n=1 Tax=Mythimna loreyi TaxID=667449 RepID=A0ACC2Q0N1_9NEOP|nr:hypothetical protein PYW08_012308 [Mythimna loreyi]
MWDPFRNISRLVTFLFIIQIGYTIAKAIENSKSCNDSTETDPRLKRSDENANSSGETDITKKIPEDPATRKSLFQPNTNNEDQTAKDLASQHNNLPQKLPLVNIANVPTGAQKEDIGLNKIMTTKAPLQQPVYYKAIDPKYLIVSGLPNPKPNKNISNVKTTENMGENNDLNKTISKDNPNSVEVVNKDEANDTEEKEIVRNDFDADVTNIRELREHLLDHLLDYFLKIIKEENFIHNDTRKKNDNDRMKVEDKLRNYYDPHHLDTLIFDDDDDDDDYEDSNLDSPYYTGYNDSDEDLLDIVNQNEEIGEENNNNITLSSVEDHVDKNTQKVPVLTENLKDHVMNYEENSNTSNSVDESFYFNVTEPIPVTSRYVMEKENNTSKANTTEKSFGNNVNEITTTEKPSIIETTSSVEVDNVGPPNYSDEVITDNIDLIYDNGAYTINDYSYEDLDGSDELRLVKNVTVHEDDGNSIDFISADGRRKNEVDKEKSIANSTLKDIKSPNENSPNTNKHTTNSSNKEETFPKELEFERRDGRKEEKKS